MHFLGVNIEGITGWRLGIDSVVLPLAISFFTFEGIAYLVDIYRGQIAHREFLTYSVFVCFFPHLIAGPIVRYQYIAGQFARPDALIPKWENCAAGCAIFIFGLFKKVILADSFAPIVKNVFDAANAGQHVPFAAAWAGALAYALQLYFDFSGYSDMATGLARLFGVQLPLNFFSPYKAINIIEFWRRWHITLSTFLRDYLYVPLGGNRRGARRRYLNLILTMTAAGLWHGAAWNFILWGTLHGIFLAINHAWRSVTAALGRDLAKTSGPGRTASLLLTFLCVIAAWVLFRAQTIGDALSLLHSMSGAEGMPLPNRLSSLAGFLPRVFQFADSERPWLGSLVPIDTLPVLALGLSIVFLSPSVPQLFSAYYDVPPIAKHSIRSLELWRFSYPHAAFLGVIAAWTLASLAKPQVFLYFNF